MIQTLLIALLSAIIVSAVSFVGTATFFLAGDRLKKLTHLLVGLAAGAMLGNALLHMLPHALEGSTHIHTAEPDHDHAHDDGHDHSHHATDRPESDHAQGDHARGSQESAHVHEQHGLFAISVMLIGFFVLFALDLTLLSMVRSDEGGVKPLAYLVLLSDGLENFMDGLVIGSAYLVSVPVGVAATIAIFLHEIPTELGDFAVLTHSGFSRKKALLFNFASAMVNTVGVILAVVLGSMVAGFSAYATPFAAGAFLYLAATGLLPQVRQHNNFVDKAAFFGMTLLGVVLMALVLLIE